MHFVVGLPQTQKSCDSIWVVVDILTKSARFIKVNFTYLVEDYARIFLDDILFHHDIPLSIISDRAHNLHLDFGNHFKEGWVLR